MVKVESYHNEVLKVFVSFKSSKRSRINGVGCKFCLLFFPSQDIDKHKRGDGVFGVISHSTGHGTDPLVIATLFCTMFLRDPPNNRGGAEESAHLNQQNHKKKKATFLLQFLVNEPDESCH